jgi:hypothetical protein
MSRRVYLLGVGLALVAMAFVVMDALLWEPGVTEANVRRIRPGMTLAQVEAILGGPGESPWDRDMRLQPRTLSTAGYDGDWHLRTGARRQPVCGRRYWEGPSGTAVVHFEFTAGAVLCVEFERRPESRSLLARLRAWLGW